MVALQHDDLSSLSSMRGNVSRFTRPPSTSTKTKTKRRSVRFNNASPQVHEIENFANDPEFWDEMWYSRDEFEIIKLRDNLLLGIHETGCFQETEEHCLRGLERRMDGAVELEVANSITLTVVLNEQIIQRNKGIYSPTRIAKAYSRVSRGAREKALSQAHHDAMAVLGRQALMRRDDSDSFSRDDASMTASRSSSQSSSLSSFSSSSSSSTINSDSSSSTSKSRMNRFFGKKSLRLRNPRLGAAKR